MKIFISWSGERSKYIASELKGWLPKVIQAVTPWMSDEDISAGTRWSTEIFKELSEIQYGIICVTPENKEKPWIMFEAGALSKSIDNSYVSPYLFDIKSEQLSGPLIQFQSAYADKVGTLKLLKGINKALGVNALNEVELEEIFDVWWDKLKKKLENVPEVKVELPKTKSQNELLSEILENTREQLRKEDIRLDSMENYFKRFQEFINQFQNLNEGITIPEESYNEILNSPQVKELLKREDISSYLESMKKGIDMENLLGMLSDIESTTKELRGGKEDKE